jgi:hypothetical protein
MTSRRMADLYRTKEVPFKLYNVPELDAVSTKWTNGYLSVAMRGVAAHVERSESNHFMFWNMQTQKHMREKASYEPPTDVLHMEFEDWVRQAVVADEHTPTPDSPHLYFMSASKWGQLANFVGDDLPFFSTRRNNFWVTNVYANKGIQCRFGMKGIIAEAHYDQGKNMVAMIKGTKRYILTPPASCSRLGIITDKRHPSFRHSVIDWSDVAQARAHNFDKVGAIDTILQRGEVLYIPSYWFHYIVSLSYSIQCNTRSGEPPNKEGWEHIDLCMKGQRA